MNELQENVPAVDWKLSTEIREEIDVVCGKEGVPTHVDTDQAIYNGEISIRSLMHLSLTFNHRAIDGVPVSQFLQAVTRELKKSS